MIAEFETLWAEADSIWTRFDHAPAFHAYVSADYRAVYDALLPFQHQGLNFLEWGSGLGIVAIMASRMGFEAVGIEAEDELIGHAERLADRYSSTAQFAHGSFIPDGFDWSPADGDESERTMIDLPDGYDQLELELSDFDLVYGYPWPTEHQLFRNILRSHGGPRVKLLTYCVREGVELFQL